MNLKKIEEITNNILKEYNLVLYSLGQKKEFGMSILEILVDGNNIDSEVLGVINELINDAIDDYLPENFYLEVSTAGAIRVLKTISEVKRQIGKYIKATKNNISTKGILDKVENDIMFIKVNDKGKVKVVEVSFNDMDEVKLTVKY